MPFFRKEKKNVYIFSALVFFHLILVSIQAPLGNEPTILEKTIFFVFSPLQHGVSSVFGRIQRTWDRYFYLRHVQSQNEEMRSELFFLRQQNNILINALRRLETEKELKERLEKVHRAFLVASVISIDADNYHKSLVINRGTADGIQKDMVVLDKFGNLVGRIIEPISLNQSSVQLITDDAIGVGVYAQGTKEIGVLTGDARGHCLLKYILTTTEDVAVGTEILTSGYDKIFPAGIRVGKIVSIVEEMSLFKNITVKPDFDFRNLELVAVLTQSGREVF